MQRNTSNLKNRLILKTAADPDFASHFVFPRRLTVRTRGTRVVQKDALPRLGQDIARSSPKPSVPRSMGNGSRYKRTAKNKRKLRGLAKVDIALVLPARR